MKSMRDRTNTIYWGIMGVFLIIPLPGKHLERNLLCCCPDPRRSLLFREEISHGSTPCRYGKRSAAKAALLAESRFMKKQGIRAFFCSPFHSHMFSILHWQGFLTIPLLRRPELPMRFASFDCKKFHIGIRERRNWHAGIGR